MQTNFSREQLADPNIAESEKIVRTCVHCGFCLATCPTYVLLGDELDSPRGRIYLIKEMLETGRTPSASTVKHIDRCLSCLACVTTCPSGVDYTHLIDHARAHIERTYRRPLPDRMLRTFLAAVLPRPRLFRLALLGAWLMRPLRRLAPRRLKTLLDLAPAQAPSPMEKQLPRVIPPEGRRRLRVALLEGCVQRALAPQINDATIRVLSRHGVEVVLTKGPDCCGAMTHHMGKETPAHTAARTAIDAWWDELERDGLDAIVANASGCGTMLKDYGHLLARDLAYAEKAAHISAIAKDVSELLYELGLQRSTETNCGIRVAYQSACSLMHGQKVTAAPKELLKAAGFTVTDIPESHLCCGSAGIYNMLQPAIADRLRERKAANIRAMNPDLVASGNIGCITQLGDALDIAVVHTVELLDWATGGPKPAALARGDCPGALVAAPDERVVREEGGSG